MRASGREEREREREREREKEREEEIQPRSSQVRNDQQMRNKSIITLK